MHIHPIVLVSADDAKDAYNKVSAWVDNEFETHGQRIYDCGGPQEVIPPGQMHADIVKPASEVKDHIKEMLDTEIAEMKSDWSVIKAYVSAYMHLDLPPDKGAFPVTYNVGIGINIGPESGTPISNDKYPTDLVPYKMYKLYKFKNHREDRREFNCIDALVYAIDDESQEALETGNWDGVWAVSCDFHY